MDLTPLLLLAASAPESLAEDAVVSRWDWSRSHRFLIESEVELPQFMWLATPFNRQARITTFHVELVTTCGQAEVETRNVVQVDCRIDQVALSASPMPSEEGLVQPIVEELDEALTFGTVQLQMNDQGRIINIDLEAIDRRNVRVARLSENLRLLLSRAYAGLDLQLPQEDESTWAQYQSWLFRAPSVLSSGGVEIVNREQSRMGTLAVIESAGRGLIYPDEGLNKYTARMYSTTTFDLGWGRIADRTWTVVGHPTASSFIAQGTAGYGYVQRGRIVALGDEAWTVGESRELPVNASPSAIQATGLGMGL